MRARGDFHIHTLASDGKPHPVDVVKYAIHVGLNTIAITDHDTFSGSVIAVKARLPFVTVIYGAEVRSFWGDILVLCPQPIKISKDPYILRDISKDNNCLLIPPHPFDIVRLGVGKKAFLKNFWDGIECFNGSSDPITNLYTCLAFRNSSLPKLSNSDAHVLKMIGSSFNILYNLKDLSRDELLEVISKGYVRPKPAYSITGLKEKLVWSVKKRLNWKESKWPGRIVTSKLGLKWI